MQSSMLHVSVSKHPTICCSRHLYSPFFLLLPVPLPSSPGPASPVFCEIREHTPLYELHAPISSSRNLKVLPYNLKEQYLDIKLGKHYSQDQRKVHSLSNICNTAVAVKQLINCKSNPAHIFSIIYPCNILSPYTEA